MIRMFCILAALISVFCYTNCFAQTDTYTFTDKNGDYQLQLPVSWKAVKAKGLVQFTLEDPANRKRQLTLEKINLYDDNATLTTKSLSDLLISSVTADEKAGKKKLLDKKTMTIDGMEWGYVSYISNKLRFKAYNIVFKKVRYAFYYIAPEKDYEPGEIVAQYCIESFRFLNKTVFSNSQSSVVQPDSNADNNLPEKDTIKKPSTRKESTQEENRLSSNPTPEQSIPLEKFICDTAHKPYKYFAFIWEGKLSPKNKTGISIIGKLPPLTSLQALSFADKRLLSIVTGKTQLIDDEGVTYSYTNIDNFPPDLDRKYQFGDGNDELLAVRSAKPFDFIQLARQQENNQALKQELEKAIGKMINDPVFKSVHRLDNEYYRAEFDKYITQPVQQVQKIIIPGINCYLVSLKENYATFLSVNNKIYLLNLGMTPDYKIYFYKLNNNYFVNLFGGSAAFNADFIVYEIRDTGLREEFIYNTNTETSNFEEASAERKEARKRHYLTY